jgi:hypothetical protein
VGSSFKNPNSSASSAGGWADGSADGWADGSADGWAGGSADGWAGGWAGGWRDFAFPLGRFSSLTLGTTKLSLHFEHFPSLPANFAGAET